MVTEIQSFSKKIYYKLKDKPLLLIIYLLILLSTIVINYNIIFLLGILSPILIYAFFNFPELIIIFMFTYGYIFPMGANRYLTGLFLLISIFGLFYNFIKNKNKLNLFKLNKLSKSNIYIFSVFTIWLLIRTITSGRIIISFDKFTSFFLLVVLIYYYYIGAPLSYKRFKQIIGAIFALGLIMTIIALINFIGSDTSDVRFTANGQNVIGFARYLVLITIISITLAFNKNNIVSKKISIISSFILFLLVILTNTKGALISLSLSVIITLFTTGDKAHIRKKIYKIMIIMLVILIVFLVLPNKYTHRYVNKGEVFSTGSFHSRLYLYEDAISTWLNNPIVGVGFGNYKFNNELNYSYPHNIFLEILSETGIIGFLLFTAFIITSFMNIESQIKNKYKYKDKLIYEIILKTSLIALLISAQFSGSIYGNSILFLICSLSIKLSSYDNNVINNRSET